MNFAAMILPERIVAALGWTLFHALWQGTLVALGFAVGLYFTRRNSARLRYGLGLAALALILLMSALTFWNHYTAAGPVAAAPTIAMVVPASPGAAGTPASGEPGQPAPARRLVAFFSDYFGRHLPLLVTLWLLGVLFLTLRFGGGLLCVQRLKYRQNRLLPELWQERLQALAARAGWRRKLRLLESLRLATPVVVGQLKPLLLLPAGLVSGLPVDEVEALLAHELAHVMRRDYLVNVAQNLVEILYFFHPGVRWISAGVRQEREHCCDDFAVELCGDAQNYARALARLQVSAAGFPEPALAAAGRPQRLLRRIVRLLGKPNLAHDFREGFLSALLLVIGLLAMVKLAAVPRGDAAAQLSAAPGAAATQGIVPSRGTNVTPPAAEGKPSTTPVAEARANRRYVLVTFSLKTEGTAWMKGGTPYRQGETPSIWLVDGRDGRVVWYKTLAPGAKQGELIPFSEEVPLEAGTYGWYFPMGSAIALFGKDADGKGSYEVLPLEDGDKGVLFKGHRPNDKLLRAEQEEWLQQELRAQKEYESRLQREQKMQEERLLKYREQLESLREAEQQAKMKEQLKLEQELQARSAAMQALKEKEQQARQSEKLIKEKQMQAELEKLELLDHDQRLREQEGQLRAEETRLRAEEKRLQAQMRLFRQFIRDLVDSGRVEKSESYRIELSGDTLMINGKKQPPAVHEKMKKLYEALTNEKLGDKKPLTIAFDPE